MAHGSHTATEMDVQQLFDCNVVDKNGESFGKVENVWVDSGEHPQFLGISTGWLGMGKTHVIPAEAAELSSKGDKVRLSYTKDTVKDAPAFDPKEDLSDAEEQQVYDFYRGKGPELHGGYRESGYGETGFAPESPAVGEQRGLHTGSGETTIPLKEEELSIGKKQSTSGGVRLKKVVRTEKVEQPVELRREELVMDRTEGSGRTTDANSIGEEEYFIPLYQEELDVKKQTREKERVHVSKQDTTKRETVADKLRTEDLKGPDSRS